MELNSKNIKKILLIIFIGSVFFTAVQNIEYIFVRLGVILGFFRPVIAALCIAFVLNVLMSALERRVFGFMGRCRYAFVRKAKRPLCILLTYLIALGVLTVLIWVILPDISETFLLLAEKLPSFANDARIWIEDMLEKFNLSQHYVPNIEIDWAAAGEKLKDYVIGYSEAIFGSAVTLTTSLASGVYNTIFSILISVYILAQKERIGGFTVRCIDAFIPKKAAQKIYRVAAQAYDSFSKFIGGQLTESVILGLLFYIGMTIFRFPNAPVISILICITSLVPIVGATIGVIIGFLLILMTSPIKALLFIVFFVVIQQIEGSLIYPKVVGKSVGLPGVIVVCAVLVGGNIGGILGALMAVPTCAVIFVLLKEAIAARSPARHPASAASGASGQAQAAKVPEEAVSEPPVKKTSEKKKPSVRADRRKGSSGNQKS